MTAYVSGGLEKTEAEKDGGKRREGGMTAGLYVFFKQTLAKFCLGAKGGLLKRNVASSVLQPQLTLPHILIGPKLNRGTDTS